MTRTFLALAAVAALVGCATTERPAPSRPGVASRPAGPVVPRPQPAPGDLVIGRSAAALVGLFGAPSLDIEEGSARKLQFAGETCVLDAYLYPPQGRGEAVVTHVDARLPDGRDTGSAACAQALRRR